MGKIIDKENKVYEADVALATAASGLELDAALADVDATIYEIEKRRRRKKVEMCKEMTLPELSAYCTAVLTRAAGGVLWPKCRTCIRPVREGDTCRACTARFQKLEASKQSTTPKGGDPVASTESVWDARRQEVAAVCEREGLVTSQMAYDQLGLNLRTNAASYLFGLQSSQGLVPVKTLKGTKLYRMDEVLAASQRRQARRRGSARTPAIPAATSPVPAPEETAMTTDLVPVAVLTTALQTCSPIRIALAFTDNSTTFAGLSIETREAITVELADAVQAAHA